MTPRVVAIVQARCGSARLPGKSLRPLQGRPLIQHVLERAQAIPGVDDVVLATTHRDLDDGLARTVAQLGFSVVRGSEQDVLDRTFLAACRARATTVVRVTGDCPFLDHTIARAVLDLHQREGYYAWNDTMHSGFPDGTDAEVFSFQMLRQAALLAKRPREREHVTPWIRDHSPVLTLRSPVDHSWLKLSIDTIDDYDRACAIAGFLPRGDYRLSTTMEAYRLWQAQAQIV